MGDEESTAQVHPQKLSQALMDAAQQKGSQLRIGEVQNIITSSNKVTGHTQLVITLPKYDRRHVSACSHDISD